MLDLNKLWILEKVVWAGDVLSFVQKRDLLFIVQSWSTWRLGLLGNSDNNNRTQTSAVTLLPGLALLPVRPLSLSPVPSDSQACLLGTGLPSVVLTVVSSFCKVAQFFCLNVNQWEGLFRNEKQWSNFLYSVFYLSDFANLDKIAQRASLSKGLAWAWFCHMKRSVSVVSICCLDVLTRCDVKWVDCRGSRGPGEKCFHAATHHPELSSGREHKDKDYPNSVLRVACSVVPFTLFSSC